MMNNQNEDSPKFPPARPEITAEVVALDCLLADLIVKCQSHPRELDDLAGILDNHLATCEIARDTLLGFAPDSNQRQLAMTDLPIIQQRMIFGAGLFSAFLLEVVGTLTQIDPTALGEKVSLRVNLQMADTSDQEITDTLKTYLIKHEEAVKKYKQEAKQYQNFTILSQNDNN
jgi:hypothetical protein